MISLLQPTFSVVSCQQPTCFLTTSIIKIIRITIFMILSYALQTCPPREPHDLFYERLFIDVDVLSNKTEVLNPRLVCSSHVNILPTPQRLYSNKAN